MILSRFPDKRRFKELAETCNVVPVCIRILADTHTPVSVLDKCRALGTQCFLLESVEGGERWARYSFLGIRPHGSVQVFSDHVSHITGTGTSEENCQSIAHNNDPLSVIRKIIQTYHPASMPELPRFWTGLTGYVTYEMVSFFENIPVSLPESDPYAHFIIPDQMIIFDNVQQTMTCLGICYLDEKTDADAAYDRAYHDLVHLLDTVKAPASTSVDTRCPPVDLEPLMPASQYMDGVNTIKHHIREGDIFQAVFSQPFSCTTDLDPVRFYRAQRYINPSPYMFFMNFGDRVIAGSSPETMVRLENGVATLRPIAGTRPRGDTRQQDQALADELLKDEKEKAEHVMLIDLGRNDLGRVAKAGTVQVTDTMVIERYSHVMHLVSNITCDLDSSYDALDLFRAAFPAGTLTGAPKIRAMEIISTLENRPRRIYGGAAGYISFTGNMDFAITIRTAVMENRTLTVQSGAGIVYDSDPENELTECINKAKSVESALKLALSHTDLSILPRETFHERGHHR
ncbi:anthranilate synthase component I family protein [Desulfotignum balticum]|jgi:anthranilate synthase component 1|uniref:anthranilate synthase component I family protein n=1 Tax=Desulfotignum balticum TaxID=115781 RepID=UPI000412806D|nr:chorismate-binding protein [Desulfotignum balticum]